MQTARNNSTDTPAETSVSVRDETKPLHTHSQFISNTHTSWVLKMAINLKATPTQISLLIQAPHLNLNMTDFTVHIEHWRIKMLPIGFIHEDQQFKKIKYASYGCLLPASIKEKKYGKLKEKARQTQPSTNIHFLTFRVLGRPLILDGPSPAAHTNKPLWLSLS